MEMRIFIVLTCVPCFFKIVHCRPGLYGLVDSSTYAAKEIVVGKSQAVTGALGWGNRFIQFGSELVSKSFEGVASLVSRLVDLSTWTKTKLVTSKASVLRYISGLPRQAVNYFGSHEHIISSFINLITIFTELTIKVMESIELAKVKIDDVISKVNIVVLNTLGEVKVKLVGGIAALVTVMIQILTFIIATLEKIGLDSLTKLLYKVLSFFVTPPRTESSTYYNSPWYKIVKTNFADSAYSAAPYFINSLNRFLETL